YRTPLHMASWNGHIEVVRLLIESGANVNHVSSTQGATAALVAAQQGHLETLSLLVDFGGEKLLHKKDIYGRDAREVAINGGHTEIVTFIDNFLAESQCTLTNETAGVTEFNSNTATGHSSLVKLSKYDPRFYSSSSNSVPSKKANSQKSKKNKSISKLSKILH